MQDPFPLLSENKMMIVRRNRRNDIRLIATSARKKFVKGLFAVCLITLSSAGSGISQDDPRLADLPKFLDAENVEHLLSKYPNLLNVTTFSALRTGSVRTADISTNLEEFVRETCPANPEIEVLIHSLGLSELRRYAIASVRDLEGHRLDPCNPDNFKTQAVTEAEYDAKYSSNFLLPEVEAIELDHYFGRPATANVRYVLWVRTNSGGELVEITLNKKRRNRTPIGRAITLLSGSTDPDWATDIIFIYEFAIGRGRWIDDL